MGLVQRMRDLMSANLNDLMDRAENPEKMLKQIVRDMETEIDRAKADTARILADQKRMEKEVDAKAREVDDWQRRAENAVDGGEDDLARQALERKQTHEKELRSLQENLEQTQEAAEQMKNAIATLQSKRNEARGRMNSLAARGKAAASAREASERSASLADPDKALGKFEKFEERIEDMENESRAARDLANSRDALEREFADREKNLAVDAELAALKARRKNQES